LFCISVSPSPLHRIVHHQSCSCIRLCRTHVSYPASQQPRANTGSDTVRRQPGFSCVCEVSPCAIWDDLDAMTSSYFAKPTRQCLLHNSVNAISMASTRHQLPSHPDPCRIVESEIVGSGARSASKLQHHAQLCQCPTPQPHWGFSVRALADIWLYGYRIQHE
jgi:hypothetical protein